MLKFDFTPALRGLNLVTINEVSVKENSRGEYLDIEVKDNDGNVHHLFNNINENTERYVIAQLCNLGNQLKLPKMDSKELLKTFKGKEAEIEIQEGNGFRIYPYTQLSATIEEGGEL